MAFFLKVSLFRGMPAECDEKLIPGQVAQVARGPFTGAGGVFG